MQQWLWTLWWAVLHSVMTKGTGAHTPVFRSPTAAGGRDSSTAGRLSVSGSRRRLPPACGFKWTGVPLSWSDVVSQGFGSGTVRRFTEGVRGGGVVSDQYNARMQVMITRNMRKVLVEELDYLPDEVDDMDPQIAAVVIEKSLPRPRAGMPIVWRKSIRRKGSAPNPVASAFGAARGMVQAVLNATLTVVTLPLRAVGAAKDVVGGGVNGKSPQLLAVVAMMVLLASDSERLSDASSTASAFGEKLKTKLKDILPGKSGDDKVNSGSGKKPSKDKENRLSSFKAAGATARRWSGGGQSATAGAETNGKTPSVSPTKGARANQRSGSASASALSQGRQGQRGSDRSRRSSGRRSAKPPRANSGTRINDAGEEGGELSVDDDFIENELFIDGFNSRRDKSTESKFSSSNQAQGNGRQGRKKNLRNFRDVSPQHADKGEGEGEDEDEDDGGKEVAGATPTTTPVPERSMRRRDLSTDATVGKRRQRRKTMEKTSGETKETTKEKGLARMETPHSAASEVDEGEEVCPDVPVNPNFNGAVWFEELPPVPPAPGTVGVLEEDETRKDGTLDDTPRWGRRPLSEHIPSEDEMAEWESNMKPSDTWLDRRINDVMGSLFGRGGNKDDSD